jgi:hypothetical protein
VHRGALVTQQVGVDRLAHDVVPERERVVGAVGEQVVVDRLAQGRRQRVVADARRGAEQLRGGRAPDRRDVRQHPPDGF